MFDKLLVTGGAGFIGSNFIRYILENNDDVKIVNLDLLTYAGSLENLKGLPNDENYSFSSIFYRSGLVTFPFNYAIFSVRDEKEDTYLTTSCGNKFMVAAALKATRYRLSQEQHNPLLQDSLK